MEEAPSFELVRSATEPSSVADFACAWFELSDSYCVEVSVVGIESVGSSHQLGFAVSSFFIFCHYILT